MIETKKQQEAGLIAKLADGTFAFIFALVAVFVVSVCWAPLSFSYPIEGDTPSLRDMQIYHNMLKDKQASKRNDAQPQVPANVGNQPVVHRSRPAPDKTQWQSNMFVIGVDKQAMQNASGGPMGTKGWDNNVPAGFTNQPLTNGDYASMALQLADAAIAIGGSPQSQTASAVANMQGMEQGIANAAKKGNLDALQQILALLAGGNINVANEATGTPVDMKAPFRPVSQALWMVHKMFHNVYMPMALLMLLPGALILNLKVIAGQGMGFAGDEDSAAGPFSAILRTIVALFLIPCTQMIMSYSIDIGNSLGYEIAKQIPLQEIYAWAKEQYDTDNAKAAAAQAKSGDTKLDPRPYKAQTFNMFIGMISMSLGYGLLIVMAFQTVVSSYLLLLGPIAAAFYTWPGGVGRLFRPVLSNWVDAVVNISLWRFWWCLLILCATTRIQWLKQIGEYVPNTEWEGLMYCCLLVLMSYVPFMPFELRPGDLVDKLLDKASQNSGGGGPGGQSSPGSAPAVPKATA